MADRLQIWKQALVHLGKATITTLTDDVEAVYVFGNAWDGVVLEAFNSGDWNFAKKSAALEASSAGAPASGYSYVFDYPDDYLRTIAVSPYAGFDDEFYDWVDEGGYLSSNSPAVYLRYISDDKTETEDAWPTMFWRYVALFLAYETCDKLTNGATKQQDLEQRLEKALRKAKSIDARNENNKVIRPGSWMRARNGYGVGNTDDGGTLVGGEIVLGDGDV